MVRRTGHERLSWKVSVVAGLALVAGCAAPRGLPGTSEPVPGPSGSTYRVEYAVRCGECMATFTTDEGPDRVAVEGFFRRTLSITAGVGQVVTLDVSVQRGRLREASISVNGDVVASASDDALFGGGGVSLSAALPGARAP